MAEFEGKYNPPDISIPTLLWRAEVTGLKNQYGVEILSAQGTADAAVQDGLSIAHLVTHPGEIASAFHRTASDYVSNQVELAQRILPDLHIAMDPKHHSQAELTRVAQDFQAANVALNPVQGETNTLTDIAMRTLRTDIHRGRVALRDLEIIQNPQDPRNTPERIRQAETEYKANAGPLMIDVGTAALSVTGVGAVAGKALAGTSDVANAARVATAAGDAAKTAKAAATAGDVGRATRGAAREANAAKAADATAGSSRLTIDARVPNERIYSLGDKHYKLTRMGGDSWFYGKVPSEGVSAIGDVKLHVNISSPEDLAKVQRVLIPLLNDDPAARELATGWKTFDPNHGFGNGEPPHLIPGPKGTRAKGFTIYTRNASDTSKLQDEIDHALTEHGLGLSRPVDTGNVDYIRGASNRVGTVRDTFTATSDEDGHLGIRLDGHLMQQLQHGRAGRSFSPFDLASIEQRVGLRPGTLVYNRHHELMLKVQDTSGFHGRGGSAYVSEAGAVTTKGDLTDRPAIYALYRYAGVDPAFDRP